MNSRIYRFAVFGCLGITAEIFFTSISENISLINSGLSPDLRLIGHSYIWMFFIYGLTAFLFPIGYQFLKNLPLVARLALYAFIIFAIEFLTGWLLNIFTGSCPWNYTTGWHIMGYIRLDYAPLWMGFGYILETVSIKLDELRL